MRTFKKLGTVMLFMTIVSANAQKTEQPKPESDTNCEIRYFYYPNLEAYFDNQKGVYYYQEKGSWTTAKEIPSGYRGYSTFNKVSVPITDYDDDNPLQFIKIHKKKYPYIMNSRQLAHMGDGY